VGVDEEVHHRDVRQVALRASIALTEARTN
jgi:hypothetical protein